MLIQYEIDGIKYSDTIDQFIEQTWRAYKDNIINLDNIYIESIKISLDYLNTILL